MENLRNEDWCQKYAIMMEDHLNLIKENRLLKNDTNSLKCNIRAIQLRNDELTKKINVMTALDQVTSAEKQFSSFIDEISKLAAKSSIR